MAASISITEEQLFTLLRAFFLTLVDCEVVRGLDNRVAMPLGAFVCITPGALLPLSTPITKYDGNAQTVAVSQPLQWTVGVDCYGASAQNTAVTLAMILRTPQGCDALPGIAPLYAGDAVQFPLIDGEAQYEERWRFDAVLQYTPIVTLPQQSALAINLGVVSVDAAYHP